MCGICGYLSRTECRLDILRNMNNTLKHRGPDDHGEEMFSINSMWNVGMAQRRLSIMDLSNKGHQPMHSCDNRIVIVFNGEIYNFQELKKEIGDYPYTSNCDTEIIIAAYMKWGINCVERLNGMFAFVLLDRQDNAIYLVRDRMGKKPLYYYWSVDGTLIWGSELKALMACPFFPRVINEDVISRFLLKSYIAGEDSIFKNTQRVEPGMIVKVQGGELRKEKYWDVTQKYHEEKEKQITEYAHAKEELRETLSRAIARRLIADVPIGAFLSGGIDSSLICALAQQQLKQPLKTYCIGFNEEQFDEAPYARNIAKCIGTQHTELYIDEKEMQSMVETIPDYYDEPFADQSQIATMLVSKLAKKDVTVALTGDAGDELFCGYNIYALLEQAQSRATWGRMMYYVRKTPFVSCSRKLNNLSIIDRIISDDFNKEAATQIGVSTYTDAINRILLSSDNKFYFEWESSYHVKDYVQRRMLLDMDTWLPEDILVKVDRASMRYALECRSPFLDKEVVELAFRIPMSFKKKGGILKWILRDLAYDYIPKEILERPKRGFCVPIDQWLRGALKEQVQSYCELNYLRRQGIFRPKETNELINRYLKIGDQGKWSGQNYSKICWTFYIFQQWYERYINK